MADTPSRMVINIERTVAYNNPLRQATPNMKLRLNNDVNAETKKWVCASWTPALKRKEAFTLNFRVT